MNRNLPPVLLVLAVSALVGGARAAHAQRPEGLSPATAVAEVSVVTTQETTVTTDSLLPARAVVPAAVAPITPPNPARGPVLLGSMPVTRPDATPVPNSPSPIAPVAIDWRMPSSNAFIAGGVVAALIGIYVVKDELGAGIAVAGATSAVFGLYLRYR